MCVERLTFDSNLFGRPIGKLMITPETENILASDKELEDFFLLYLFSKYPLDIRNPKISYRDEKVLFAKKVTEYKFDEPNLTPSIRLNNEHCIDDRLVELAYMSGEYSRFRRDQKISVDVFQALYTTWLQKSFNCVNTEVITCQDSGLICGFITVEIRPEAASIGLIAVDSKNRGRGYGRMLVNQAFKLAQMNNCERVLVYTQAVNDSAMKFYRKLGFLLSDVTYIYHYWPQHQS